MVVRRQVEAAPRPRPEAETEAAEREGRPEAVERGRGDVRGGAVGVAKGQQMRWGATGAAGAARAAGARKAGVGARRACEIEKAAAESAADQAGGD
jgi:hypothetical protein